MTNSNEVSQESLANDVVARFERLAIEYNMIDTADLYTFLLFVPRGLLKSYLDRNVYSNGVQIDEEREYPVSKSRVLTDFFDEFANDYDRLVDVASDKLDDMFIPTVEKSNDK